MPYSAAAVKEKGIRSMTVNGKPMEGNLIPELALGEYQVEAVM